MDYVKVHCHNCNADFELYNHAFHHREKPPMCPHCLRSMTEKQWERLRFAYFTFCDVNKLFRVDHDERGKTLFQAEIRMHYVSDEKIELED